MLYPTYYVNGTPMADPLGRWHEHEDNDTLPAFGGLRAASLTLAGVGGERSLPQAPIEAKDFVLRMVINAVDDDGRPAQTQAERRNFLHTNVQTLMRTFQVGEMTQGGFAVISLYWDDRRIITTSGRLEASIESEYIPGSDYAEIDFVFRLPFGVWRGAFVSERIAVPTNTTAYIRGLANSTAPIDGPFMTLTGPFTYLQVTNQFGNGFRYTQPLTATQAVLVDAEHWTSSDPFTIEAGADVLQVPNVPVRPTSYMSQIGQAAGTALTLIPSTAEGIPVMVAGAGRSSATSITIHTTEAFF